MARQPFPIPVNPGGVLAIEHIIGRDEDCHRILRALETRSIVLTGERRMGKTSLARLVEHHAPAEGWVVVQQSAEGYTSLGDLAQALASSCERLDGSLIRTARAIAERTTVRLPGIEISGDPGARHFEDVVEAAVETANGKLLLILDELPLFARSLNARSDGREEGTAALHLLRRLREMHRGLRMLCLGSVGFHHVIREASGVLNDTSRVRLEPLSTDDASFLARCLLLGVSLGGEGEAIVADAIARDVECVPYYVHKVVESAELVGRSPLGVGDVDRIVDDAFTGHDDPWDLRHYRDRLPLYYGEDTPMARAVLDAVAAEQQGVDVPGLLQRLATVSALTPLDDERVRGVLERLEDDHYLVRDGQRRSFAFSLVRRAWIELHR